MDSVVGLDGLEELFVWRRPHVLIRAHTTRSVWHEEQVRIIEWKGHSLDDF
jgi:hypothetical protein